MRRRWLRRGLKIAAIGGLAVAVFGLVVTSLWNWLGPAVFGAHTITFWQGLGLLVLARILFGGMHGRPGRPGHWSGRMRDRWNEMTPEERERFRQGIRSRCGGDEAADGGLEAAKE